VLDNFEQVLDAAVDVAGVVGQCAYVKIIVTSRECSMPSRRLGRLAVAPTAARGPFQLAGDDLLVTPASSGLGLFENQVATYSSRPLR